MLRTRDAQLRHASKSPPTNPPSHPPTNLSVKCAICRVNQPPPGKTTCKICFQAKQASMKLPITPSTTLPHNTNITPPSLCTVCGSRTPNPGKKWCESCYQSHKSQPPSSHTPPPPRDFTKNKVKFSPSNDVSVDYRDWSSKKLKEMKRCYYCAELLSDHKVPCRDKYPHYHSTEVLTLLRVGITPPTRNAPPEGPPISP